MTDMTARPDTLSKGQRDRDTTLSSESDETAKWSWQKTIGWFWSHSEETGEMDTQPFKGLL